MVVGSRNKYIAFGANKFFIPKQVISTCIAKPGEKETDKIVPQISEVIHAANRIISIKIKIFLNETTNLVDCYSVKAVLKYQSIISRLIVAAILLNSSDENVSFGFLKFTSSIESIGTRWI
jgi:hypothetical protein